MNYAEAQAAVAPYINAANAAELASQTDEWLWIEENIMIPAGINSSVCSYFGERVACHIENEMAKFPQ
ncbi:MAG: hypothetical protein GY813_07560 [Halieaceae bacterium]|nr:hypothetical protein [Halieaceae bacterium]